MIPGFDKEMEGFLTLPYEDRVKEGRIVVSKIFEMCKKGGLSEEDTFLFFRFFTKLFVSADQVLNGQEYDYFIDITGFNIDKVEFLNMVNYGADPDFIDDCIELIKMCNKEERAIVCLYGALLTVSDGKLSIKEIEIIERLLEA